MSRIYDNQPLQSVPVVNHDWKSEWNPEKFQTGRGAIFEGTIKTRSRHVITDTSKKKLRYVVFHIKVKRAHRRQFDSSGKEIEPNFSETTKVSTGYLHSSYKTEAKGQTDRISLEELNSLLSHSPLQDVTTKHNPADCVSLWVDEADVQGLELLVDDEVRVKTKGDGPFVYSIAKLDDASSTVSNYAGGEKVGGSWTDKIMTMKNQDQDRSLPQEQNEGVDEDEWDD